MKVEIKYIKDFGDPEKERVVFKVNAPTNIGLYEKKSVLNKDGSTTYFFYWGLENPLSSVEKSCVVLFETSWMFKEAFPSTADNDETKEQTE